jgi:hypothetical protein
MTPTQVALYANVPDPPKRVAVFRWSQEKGVTLELLDDEWASVARRYYDRGIDLQRERRLVKPSEGPVFMRTLLQQVNVTYYTLRDESDQ